MRATYRDFLELFLLFCGSLLIFTWGLSSQEVVAFDSRFYLFALEMWRHGISLFPTTYSRPYPDYPVTSTALIYFFACLYGGLNKLIAILPSAIAASLTVVTTYLIGCLHQKRLGFYAVLFLLLTIGFLKSARSISLDMYPTLLTAGCFYLIYSADLLQRPRRSRWIYPLMTISFAFRGPIGLVMPAGVICVYYFLNLRIKKLVTTGIFAFLLLVALVAVLFAVAYYAGGETFLRDVMRMQALGRIDNYYRPIYYYMTASLGGYALSFPLACLVLLGVAICKFKNENMPHTRFLLYLTGWVLIIMLGMSVPGDKKLRYILPIVPALSLLAAYPLAMNVKQTYFCCLRAILGWLFLFFPALCLLAIELIYLYAHRAGIDYKIPFVSLIFFFVSAQSIALITAYFCRHALRFDVILTLATAVFLVFYLTVVEPVSFYYDKARDAIAAIEMLRLKQDAQLVFYKEQPDGLPIKYLIDSPVETKPIFIETPAALLQFSGPAFFVASAARFAELAHERFTIIATIEMGHVRLVVFQLKQKGER